MEGIGAHPRFSVIIPTYKRPELLKLCLEKLAPGVQAYTGQYEVIVSDDDPAGSARATLKQSFPWVRWVQGPGKGPAANRNAGAAEAHGEWLAFTDDDCLPEPGWLDAFEKAILANENAQVLEGKTMPSGVRRSLAEVCPANEYGGYLWSCNFAMPRKLFVEIGGFDQGFRHACMEDVDLSDRIQQMGLNMVFVSQALVFHPWKKAKKPWDDGQGGEIYYPALMHYLSKHPGKAIEHNTKRYLNNAIGEFLKESLPGLFTFAGRGFGYALRHHCYQIRIAWRRRNNP